MGLLHWLLDVVLGWALLRWTYTCAGLCFYLLFSIGWQNKLHPPPGRLKLLSWWAGLSVAAAALLATPPLVLWFGIAHGFWITVTVQAALLAAPLALAARTAWRHRPPPPKAPEPPPPTP